MRKLGGNLVESSPSVEEVEKRLVCRLRMDGMGDIRSFLGLLGLLLRACSPVCIVDRCVLQQGGKHKHETHHKSNSSACCLVVDPERDPGQHDDEDRRQVSLEHEVADVPLEFERQG
uniref:Uncharacterized protein n=1 Tax=Timema tahoe TaxID=61484 RepID=A0A7R9IKM7_9NEOP|nr:unnamed protein product [Timema tahoe]